MKILKAPKFAVASLTALSVAVGAFAVSTIVVEPAYAQRAGSDEDKPKRKTKKAQVIRNEKLGKVLQEAVELMSAEPPDLNGALAAIRRAPASDKLSSYERSKVYQIQASIAAQQERYNDAIGFFSSMISEEDTSPVEKEQATFNIAQLYMVTEQFQNAVNILEKWFQTAESPAPSAYFWLCQGYLQLEDYKKALSPCTDTIRVAQERDVPVIENWVRAAVVSYQQSGDLENATNWIKYALLNWPKRDYWIQYVSMMSQRGLEKQELAAYEIAYKQGFLTRETEIVRLAQMYQYHQIPFKAVKVLEKGIADGIVEESRKHLELLANVYTLSKEYGDAVDPLQKAAALANEGKLWERLAQTYLQDEEWDKASDALSKAISTGGISNPFRTRILEGMALANSGEFSKAEAKFKEARKDAKDARERNQIKGWLRYVEDEKRRSKDIATYRIKKYGTGAN